MSLIIDRYKDVLDNIEEQPQTQRSTSAQLLTLAMFANKLGMYDAAQFLKDSVDKVEDKE